MRPRGLLLGAALLAAALACTLPSTGGDQKSAGAVETQVAATLTALSPAADAQAPASPTAEPVASPTVEPMVNPGQLVVVFISGGHPYLWTPDDGAHQLSSTGDVIDIRISDDAQWVVFVRRQPADGPQPVELRAIRPDGSGEVTLLTPDDFDSLHPTADFPHNDLSEFAFVHGTHNLLLNTRALPEGPGLARYNDLLRLKVDSGELTPLLPAEQGGSFTVSPDGGKLAIVRADSVSLASIDGTFIQDQAITFDPIITYSEFQYHVEPVWEPDSSAVLVAVPSTDPLAEDPSGSVWRIPADGGSAAQVATIQGQFYFPQLSGGSLISPQLQQVAYLRESGNSRQLYLSDLDGANEIMYDSDSIDWRGWSPDGSRFVYRSSSDNVLTMGIPGQPPYVLVTGDKLSWIGPDSFLFLQGTSGDRSLYRGWTEAGDPQLISHLDGDASAYDWARP